MSVEVKVFLIGRVLALSPASLGVALEPILTYTKMTMQSASRENGWKKSYIPEERQLFWYDDDPITGEKVFCTYSGSQYTIINKLKELFGDVQIIERVDSQLGQPDFNKINDITWRPRQAEVLSKILAYRCGIIKCPPGFGKTFICKQLARLYPTKRIVITCSVADVAKKIYHDLAEDMTDVGLVGAGSHQNNRITVAVAMSLKNCIPEANLVLFDEAHTLLTDNYMKTILRFSRARFFGFTATPKGRSDRNDPLLEALFGPVIAEVKYQEAVETGNVTQIKVKMYRCNEGPDLSNCRDSVQANDKGIWVNPFRNRLLQRMARDAEGEVGNEGQVLLMVDTTEHAYNMKKLLPDYTVVSGPISPSREATFRAEGLLEEDEVTCTKKMRDAARIAFERNILKRVICTKVWSTGVDFVKLSALIRGDGIGSIIAACQVSGRTSRIDNANINKVGLLYDSSDDWDTNLHRRAGSRMSEYKRNGWEIEYID